MAAKLVDPQPSPSAKLEEGSVSRLSAVSRSSLQLQRSSPSKSTATGKFKSGTFKSALLYNDFDDIPLGNVVSNVDFLNSERAFNRNSGLLDALKVDIDPGDPFEMLTLATSRVDDGRALGRRNDVVSSRVSAEERLLLHDVASCNLAQSALRRLRFRGGGLHRRLEDPGLKDFRLYLSSGYEKQEKLYKASFSNSIGPQQEASEGNIFAATSLFKNTVEGTDLGHTSRTLQQSACEVALLHHLSLARRAYALVSKGRFLQALSVCIHAMRSKTSDTIMSHLLKDALHRQALGFDKGKGAGARKPPNGDANNVQLMKQAALEIHTFFIHIMATACGNMGSFLHAIKLYASWIAAIHVDAQWWFSASVSSFQLLAPEHLTPQLPLSQREHLVSAAKAITAIHLMCGQFSNEVMSACLCSCSKQRQDMRKNLSHAHSTDLPSLESEMSAVSSKFNCFVLFVLTRTAGLHMTALLSSIFYASTDQSSFLGLDNSCALLQVNAFMQTASFF
jgi:hypothetical protein